MAVKTLKVKMQLRIAKSPRSIFEAIVDPAQMSKYFTSFGSDRLDSGKAVRWKFADVGVELAIAPKKVLPSRISFAWSASGVETTVVMSLKRVGKTSTLVSVTESKWLADSKGIDRCIGQTRGWTHMLSCMKAYLEYGIHLRKGGTIK